MRSNSTKTRLNILVLFTVLLGSPATAQTVVDVTASGGTFTPTDVTIDVGDTVRWTNSSGTHNVNGTTVTFPTNPESFGNALDTGWVFTYVFNTAGNYEYQCDLHEAFGMTGTVTVVSTSDIGDDLAASNNVVSNIYPIPSSEFVVIELTQELLSTNTELTAVVYDLMGKEILRSESITDAKITLNTEGWTNSAYVFHLMSDSRVIATEQIIIQ
jgi:plastocyanin